VVETQSNEEAAILDAQLLAAAIKSRASYEAFAPHFTEEDFTPISKFWFSLIREWYAADRHAQSIDKSLLAELGKKRITNAKHEESLVGFIRELPEPPSADNVVRVALELKRHNVEMELGAALGQGDRKKSARLLPVLQQLQQATDLSFAGRKSEWQDAVSVEKLFDKVGKENRIPIAPLSLNAKCDGGALPGHHIIIFGRPEAGKSMVSINMAYGFMKQKKRGLYVGNEDQIDILKSRMLSRVTRMPFAEAEANREKALRLYRARGGEDYILMSQLAHGTVDAIARRIEADGPFDFVVLDQIRNISAGGGEGDGKLTSRLEAVGREMRSLLLDYGLIGISVTQANDRTERANQEPPLWLGMGDIDSSRTGLPGTGDLLVGVGLNRELKARNQRALSTPKNKLSSAPDAHEGVIVEVEPAISRVR
jgi:hypothetical protein